MSHHHDTPVIDRRMIRAAALLVLVSVVGAAYARITGEATVTDPRTQIVQVRALHFEDRMDGAVVVRDGAQPVAVFEPGEGGFVRGALRALARYRRLDGGSAEDAPIELIQWVDGRVSLEDPETGESIVLNAFGPDNLRPFAQLFEQPTALVRVDGKEHDA